MTRRTIEMAHRPVAGDGSWVPGDNLGYIRFRKRQLAVRCDRQWEKDDLHENAHGYAFAWTPLHTVFAHAVK